MDIDTILEEREKTHGDFEEFAKVRVSLARSLGLSKRPNLTDAQSIAASMILTKLARIVCGDPNFADHWDDIAGYAMLGKGKAKGVFQIDTEWPKIVNKPCKHPTKERKYFADTADGFRTVMTVDYCHDCNKMHIVDCEQKKEAEKSTSSKMEYMAGPNHQPSNNTGTIEFYVAGYNDEIYIDFKDCQIWAQSIDEQLEDLFKYYGKLNNRLGLSLPLLGGGQVNVKLYIPKGLFDIWVNLPISKDGISFIDYLKINHFMSIKPYESLDNIRARFYAEFVYQMGSSIETTEKEKDCDHPDSETWIAYKKADDPKSGIHKVFWQCIECKYVIEINNEEH